MQVDPIGFRAGDANLYRVEMNRPTTLSDPSGRNTLVLQINQAYLVGGLPYVTTILEGLTGLTLTILTIEQAREIARSWETTGNVPEWARAKPWIGFPPPPPPPPPKPPRPEDVAAGVALAVIGTRLIVEWVKTSPFPFPFPDPKPQRGPDDKKDCEPKRDCDAQLDADQQRCNQIASEMWKKGYTGAEIARWKRACYDRASGRKTKCDRGEDPDRLSPYPAPPDIDIP
jgi:hypothetical protein